MLLSDKRILNISSASAKYLLPSQSCYSTAKAGLDSFTKSIDIEQKLVTYPAKVTAVYPGMIDTHLQSEIRSVSKDLFPYVNEFIQLSEEGKLQTPEYTAHKLIEILLSEDFGKTVVIESIAKGLPRLELDRMQMLLLGERGIRAFPFRVH